MSLGGCVVLFAPVFLRMLSLVLGSLILLLAGQTRPHWDYWWVGCVTSSFQDHLWLIQRATFHKDASLAIKFVAFFPVPAVLSVVIVLPGAGLERVQCPQCALFPHSDIQDQRVHCCEAARHVRLSGAEIV
jgi:hypothetical protein